MVKFMFISGEGTSLSIPHKKNNVKKEVKFSLKGLIRQSNVIQHWNPVDSEIMMVKSDLLGQRLPFGLGV